MHTLKRALIATTVLTVLGSPLIVRAQSAPANGAASNPNMGEVVVQAQRRSERLQDVPLSVTAIQGSVLQDAGVTNSLDLTMVTPGLNMSAEGLYVEPTIRGIGSNVALPGEQPNVATYIDNAYQPEPFGAIYDLPDVVSIDVLKGPQGTLFGKNATGGAILVTTKSPNLTHPEGDFYVSYGNYNSYVVKGFFSAPIVQDRLAFSFSGLYDHTDGWKTNIFTGCKTCAPITTYLLRAKLRFVPWEGADFTLTGMASRRTDLNVNAGTLFMGNTVGANLNPPTTFPPNGFPGAIVPSRPWTYDTPLHTYVGQQRSLELQGNIDLGPGKLSLTTYYNTAPNTLVTGITYTQNDPFSASIPQANHEFSQEVLYTTNQIGRFHAVGGFYYFKNLVFNQTNFNLFPGFTDYIWFLDRDESYAVFGDVTADVTDKFSITGGLRYTDDSRKANGLNTGGPSGITVAPPQSTWFYGVNGVSPAKGGQLGRTWNSWTAKITALYKITPHTNVYFNFSQGFSSGVFNQSAPFNFTPANPETVNAFEGGIKSNELRNLSFSAAAFYYDYHNFQTNHAVFSSGNLATIVSNAPRAAIYGGEIDAQWRATENLDITAGVTVMSAKYTDYPNALVNQTIFCTTAGRTYPCGNIAKLLPPPAPPNTGPNISNTWMIRTAPWSGDVTAHYHRDLGPGRLDASATVSFSGKVYWDYDQRVPQNPYALVNGIVSYTPNGTNLRLSVWAKNITNAAVIDSDGSNQGFVGYDNVDYVPPRTFGVSAEYKF